MEYLEKIVKSPTIDKMMEVCRQVLGMGVQIRDANHDILKSKLSDVRVDFCAVIYSFGYRNHCFECDKREAEKACKMKKPHIYACYAGLDEINVPIIVNNEYLGYVISGQVLDHTPTEKEFEQIKKNLSFFNIDWVQLKEAYMKVPVFSKEKLKLIVNMFTSIVNEIISNYNEVSQSNEVVSQLTQEIKKYKLFNIIGMSKKMQDLFGEIEKVLDSERPVLIQGETGVGKELVARAIHYNCPRRNNPLIAENCSAFNENLLETEFFGYERGAFTGADKLKKGLFELADKGTLFLDEVADLSLNLQAKLLRVLEEGIFKRVGGTEFHKIDVRVISATNKDIKSLVRDEKFREDLYYRLKVFDITIPPLRERKEDIPLLIDYFLKQYCKELGVERKTISPESLQVLMDFDWPGNVRQLKNEIEKAVISSKGRDTITEMDLSKELNVIKERLDGYVVPMEGNLKNIIQKVEMDVIKEGLRKRNGNKTKLAKDLGISRLWLIKKVKKYKL